MSAYLKRQLADYVEYHRDPRNCAMHVFGILTLFLAAILPLSLWPIHLFGATATVATVLVVPVLIYWLLLDAALGLAIVAVAVLLLATATVIVDHASIAAVGVMAAVLGVIGVGSQVVGHRVFERRQPSMVDNPTHFLLGPIFVMAKLFIALGFRRDLARVIAAEDHQPKPLPHS